ncbi:hypothetical protein EDD86DRAFT_195835 [Gorgonomyces haynaldii]|nr:hypothetical protein EDD86DRAFT_195835 [Gorgonomyces haynaldii]
MPDRSQIITFETSQDVSIQSNCALRPHRFASLPLDDLSPPPAYDAASGEGCYYEVEILELGKECTFALGFATCPYPPFRLPGWDTHSVAVHSDDGAKFLNDVDYGQPYSRPFGPGDRVGFGYEIIPMNGQWEFQFYLVLNGTRLPNCFERVQYLFDPLHMYPTIGSDGHCKIVVRFF